jgi:hypothetical protein
MVSNRVEDALSFHRRSTLHSVTANVFVVGNLVRRKTKRDPFYKAGFICSLVGLGPESVVTVTKFG